MSITRRNFFRNAAAGAVAAAALPPLADLAFSELVPASRASEPGGPIILSRNENAYGPSQIVTTSMQDSLQFANRYPDPAVKALHEASPNLIPSSRNNWSSAVALEKSSVPARSRF